MKVKNLISAAGWLFALLLIGNLFYHSSEKNEPSKEVSTPLKLVSKPITTPTKLQFAGEKVPLDNFDVYESMDREMQVNAYWHSQALYILKRYERYFRIIEPILKEEGVPDDFKYLAIAESNLNEKAVSPVGATGIWQFMKATAREHGLEVSSEVDERYHLEKATRAACKYLKKGYEKFGSWTTVAATYNAGRARIIKEMKRQEVDNYYDLLLNQETARYVYRILAMKLLVENPAQFNFEVKKSEMYPYIPVKNIKVTSKVSNFAQFAQQHGINYKILKQFNPWLRQNKLTNRRHKTYNIAIPLSRKVEH